MYLKRLCASGIWHKVFPFVSRWITLFVQALCGWDVYTLYEMTSCLVVTRLLPYTRYCIRRLCILVQPLAVSHRVGHIRSHCSLPTPQTEEALHILLTPVQKNTAVSRQLDRIDHA